MEMTIEGFFLADYQRMRERIEELEAKVAEYEHNERTADFGCFDLRKSVDAVCVRTASSYEYKRDDLFTAERLDELIAMGDDELLEWARRRHKVGDWTTLEPIEVDRHRYQYTLRFVESRSDNTFVTDGERRSSLIEMCDEACIGSWVDASLLDECIALALEVVRENLREARAEMSDE